MRINSISRNIPSFKDKTNKILLKGLEIISEHGATFSAGTAAVGALCLRPLAVQLAPKTDVENKKYASANSLASGAMKFLAAETIIAPIEYAVKKIDKNPENFLKSDTIKNLKNGANSLVSSADYKFATGIIKQGAGLISAIPKSVLTVALIPLIMDKITPKKKIPAEFNKKIEYPPVFKEVFFGKNILAKNIGKILNSKNMQDLANKHSSKKENIARNISVATDILLTTVSATGIKKSKKIEKERKNPLIYNSIISTGASILFGCAIDESVKKGTKKSIQKFINSHKNDPKLEKYIEGLNILRPTIIFALIYYGILPIASTFFADKIDKIKKEN